MKGTVVLSANTSWYLFNFRKGTILRLIAEDYRVVCLAPRDSYSERLEELAAEFSETPLDEDSVRPLHELKSLLAIFVTVWKLKPDFVFNFTIKMNLYMGLSCRVLGIPYSNNVSGLGTVFLHQGLTYKLAKKLYGPANNGAQTVFFQNDEDKQTFIDLGLVADQRSVLLPGSGIDLKHFSYTRLPKTEPFTFIMIARLIADKGVREYIDAARIVNAHAYARFILVGPSGVCNTSAITDDEIAQWRKEGVVEYVGNQDEVIPWIRQARVLVLPSYREGMPRAVLEAASIGRPAIVTDVPGCRQSIEAGVSGWLCKLRDARDLSRVMQSVMALPADVLQSFADAARSRVENEFSETRVIEAYMACLP